MRFNGPTCRFCGDDVEPHPMLAGILPNPFVPYDVIVPLTEEARSQEFTAMMKADAPWPNTPTKFRTIGILLCDICRTNAAHGKLKVAVDPQ